MIDRYFAVYAGVRSWLDGTIAAAHIAAAHQCGFVRTLLGRKRYIPELSSNNFTDRRRWGRAGRAQAICRAVPWSRPGSQERCPAAAGQRSGVGGLRPAPGGGDPALCTNRRPVVRFPARRMGSKAWAGGFGVMQESVRGDSPRPRNHESLD